VLNSIKKIAKQSTTSSISIRTTLAPSKSSWVNLLKQRDNFKFITIEKLEKLPMLELLEEPWD
jgi:hypothetical protein